MSAGVPRERGGPRHRGARARRTSLAGSVATAVARRSLRHAFTNPALLVPSILFPLVFLLAFAGGLSNIDTVPGFDYPPGYTTFQFVFVFLQSAAFGGIFTGFGIAADFESGFARRLLLAASNRPAILLGYALSACARFLFTTVWVTIAALIGGLTIAGGGADLFGLLALGLLVNATAIMFAAGVSYRARTLQAGPFMQIPIFLVLFLAPVYVPLHLLTGWIKGAASLNPATAFLQAGRGFLSGAHETTGVAFACGAGLVILMTVYALRGLRKAERSA
jgi:ABC-2 type transport system permease protein